MWKNQRNRGRDPKGLCQKDNILNKVHPLIVLAIFGFFSLAFTNKTPLFFIENHGQADPKIKFYLKGVAQSVSFGEGEIIYSTPRRAIRQRFIDANRSPSINASKKLAGQVNYLVGKDEKDWKQNIPIYEEIAYQNLYPGIDLVFQTAEGKLKSEFRVARGADYKKILVAFNGADPLTLSDTGDLVIKNTAQEVREERPIIYQVIDGKKVFVDGKFIVRRNQYHFEIPRYDPNHSLIIDPTIVFSTYFGGNEDDMAQGVATDPSGNVYITGATSSSDFYTSPTAFQSTLAESSAPGSGTTTDAFVVKLSPRGLLIYSTFVGGNDYDQANGIAVDSAGNAFITGETLSSNFPTTPLAYQETLRSRALHDAFVTKLNPSGDSLIYSTYLGGKEIDGGTGIALDPSGNAYVTGVTTSLEFPTTTSAYQNILGGSEAGIVAGADVFVSKLNPSGASLIYSTYVGGSTDDVGLGIAIGSGNAFVTGYAGPDFPITPGAFQETFGGGFRDAFIFKLNATGSSLIYSTYLGGSGVDDGNGIAIRGGGKAFVTGMTTAGDFPITPGAFQETFGGSADAFVVQLNGSGSSLHYSTFLGGSENDYGLGIAVNRNGRAFVTGWTDGVNFPVTPFAYQGSLRGADDVIVSVLNQRGSLLIYSTYLGGNTGVSERGMGIAIDKNGRDVFVTGSTASDNFPRVLVPSGYRGGLDPFITKIHFGP